jgi:gas vesicle protein
MSIPVYSKEATALRDAFSSLAIGYIFTTRKLAQLAYGSDSWGKNGTRASTFLARCRGRGETVRNQVRSKGVVGKHKKVGELGVYDYRRLYIVPKEFQEFSEVWNNVNTSLWFSCESFRNVLHRYSCYYSESEELRKFFWHLNDKGLVDVAKDKQHEGHYLYKRTAVVCDDDLEVFKQMISERLHDLVGRKAPFPQYMTPLPTKKPVTKQPITKQPITKTEENVTMKTKDIRKHVINTGSMTDLEFVDSHTRVYRQLIDENTSMSRELKSLVGVTEALNNEKQSNETLKAKQKQLEDQVKYAQDAFKKQVSELQNEIIQVKKYSSDFEEQLLRQQVLVEERDESIHNLNQKLLDVKIPKKYNLLDVLTKGQL